MNDKGVYFYQIRQKNMKLRAKHVTENTCSRLDGPGRGRGEPAGVFSVGV
jgi:hypothetical protein